MQADFDLVRLLIILVRPHVIGKGPRQGIEGDELEAVANTSISQDGKRLLQRKHCLDDSTEFAALGRVAPGVMLITGKHSVGQAVIPIQRAQHLLKASPVGGVSGHERPNRRSLERLAVVYAVGRKREISQSLALIELDHLAL